MAEFFRGIEASTRVDAAAPADRAARDDASTKSSRRSRPTWRGERRGGAWAAAATRPTTCQLRQYATEYGADPTRFAGARRKFRRDSSHPDVVYEPGKCILCGACVAVAERAGDGLGLAIVGRGFDAAVAVPLKGTLIEALPAVARDVAAVCPTGAFALEG